ncbi:formate dehydrogenase accessory sulfurtransferase FdhD [Alsobacter soli]|uniref:formate dehydrogenase accessory sulfurtransferase FdhD n=1 Tax=Alsobacter soli TaxID=2109933 RepID=UPI0013047DC5|nr:formate dehydrogenase accessory sulfurtransferase FdhD [Alsobacter soli]
MSDADDDIEILSEPPPPRVEALTVAIARDGQAEERARTLAAEVPVSITYNGLAHAVMMASPIDVEDFVVGFSLTEQIVERAEEVEDIVIRPIALGLLAQATIPAHRQKALLENRRNLVGQTGCGICGIVELEQAVRRFGAIETKPLISGAAVFAALDALYPLQRLNRETGAVHAAAFVSPSGEILAVREDVGRHNALDKLIGYMARAGIPGESGFCLMTSRISFELVQKCLAARIPALAGISAPTSLAVRLSQEHRLTLIALARSDTFQIFSDPHALFRDPGDSSEGCFRVASPAR